MKATLPPQQTAFYTQNGFIELELGIQLPDLTAGRDLFRTHPSMKTMILQKLAPIALALTRQSHLRLAMDEFLSPLPQKAQTLKDLFSIQGFAIGAILRKSQKNPQKKSPLGILPYPSQDENVLFFRPDLILDFPHTPDSIYMVLFSFPNAVYVQNPNDPNTNYLKKFGYAVGDTLKNEHHPLIFV